MILVLVSDGRKMDLACFFRMSIAAIWQCMKLSNLAFFVFGAKVMSIREGLKATHSIHIWALSSGVSKRIGSKRKIFHPVERCGSFVGPLVAFGKLCPGAFPSLVTGCNGCQPLKLPL